MTKNVSLRRPKVSSLFTLAFCSSLMGPVLAADQSLQPPQPPRKSSPPVSEEEKGQAREFRKNALKSSGMST
jgi:hypothetical protein